MNGKPELRLGPYILSSLWRAAQSIARAAEIWQDEKHGRVGTGDA